MKAGTISVILTGACICLVPFVYAGDADPVEMEEVVVTGTRNEQQVKNIPANVTVIDQEAIKNSTARDRGRTAAR